MVAEMRPASYQVLRSAGFERKETLDHGVRVFLSMSGGKWDVDNGKAHYH